MQLCTERLELDPLDPSSVDPFTRLHADPSVTQYLSPCRPLTPAESFRLFAQILGHWQLRGFGYWAIRDRDAGRWLGMVGLWYPLGWPGIELGWRLFPEFWGKEFAYESALRVVHHAQNELGMRDLLSLIHVDNARSIRLAERLGFTALPRKPEATSPVDAYHLRL